ncbi:MAG: pyruvate formate lyase family protein [Eubacteriales bacterium]|nr:pyruvate formate lyase family protein [Eubacteriales bacterium]
MSNLDQERSYLQSGAHRARRRELSPQRWQELSARIQTPSLTLPRRAALRLRLFLEEETIVRRPGERIPCWRTLISFPDLYAPGEKEGLQAGHYIHEQGRVCNISSDWEGALRDGLLPRRDRLCALLAQKEGDADYLTSAIACIDAVLAYADRYEWQGLSHAVRHGARTYEEALQAFRMLHFCLWASNVYHNTVGRFDQFMFPYYQADMEAGRLTPEDAQALTEEFFLSFNRDSDLYSGMQQGDNGQSLMLGGCDAQGNCAVNALTGICLTASLRNRCIDPKINLRVTRDTPLELFERCTALTRQGLGFPQYANDDVVIPALIRWGYAPEDARNYTVAACWEFIVPGTAMDIPNIGAVSLAKAVRDAIAAHLKDSPDYDTLFARVKAELTARADTLEASVKPLWMEPAPYQSVLMCDYSHDISQGAKYNNYGIHGTGFADAVDQLCAVKKYVFEQKTLCPDALLAALAQNFEGAAPLLHLLREDAPKLGRDTECLPIADALLDAFAGSWEGRKNERSGIFRPGTGSAMYYLWHAKDLGALSDGHRAGEVLCANLSPSLLVRDAGPLSVIQAMARPGLPRVMNGGPLTLELHDTVFQNQEGMTKVAQLVRSFIQLGGHQLQLNAVDRDTLLDAQAHPEAHRNLIVRVWGWSGHFVQLDKAYQDQIIARTSYTI